MVLSRSVRARNACDPDRRRLLRSASAEAMRFGLANRLALESMAKSSNSARHAKQGMVIYEEGGISQRAMSNSAHDGLPHPVMMPSLDRSFSALLADMSARGLLDETRVCFITEMGRTPHINKWAGRDHWARAMSIAFAGAGVRGGQVIGAANLDGGEVIDRRYTPDDYAETIYCKLGIDTDQRLHKADGLPVPFSDDGEPIRELF